MFVDVIQEKAEIVADEMISHGYLDSALKALVIPVIVDALKNKGSRTLAQGTGVWHDHIFVTEKTADGASSS